MLTHPTLDQLRQLGLAGMARAYEELTANPRGGELDHAEWLGLLLDRELGGPVATEPKLHFSSRRRCFEGRATA